MTMSFALWRAARPAWRNSTHARRDASEGLKLARNGHVDLVLLDVGLPDLDGREACKLLRRGGFKGPIVMLTAQVSDADTILGLDPAPTTM